MKKIIKYLMSNIELQDAIDKTAKFHLSAGVWHIDIYRKHLEKLLKIQEYRANIFFIENENSKEIK